MAKEIERKFLVISDSYLQIATNSYKIVQGYLSTAPNATVRVRVKGEEAYLTVKSKNTGIVRNEWEYPIPVSDALAMLESCHCATLSKVRYIVPFEGHIWEVDVFEGGHRGLVLAEIELKSADESFSLPDFVGIDVSDDPQYYNSNLSKR